MLRKMTMLAAAAVMIALTGCLPIELDVSPNGQMLIPRQEGLFQYDPATGEAAQVATGDGGEPAFAMYIPNSEAMLLVRAGGGGGMGGGSFNFTVVDPKGGARQVHSASNVTYATVAPDGKHIALSRVADKQSETFEQNMPELKLVNLADGTTTDVASDVSVIHRWLPDGKGVLALHLLSKDEESDLYTGQIVTYDLSGKQAQLLGTVVGPDGVFMDISPDGTKLLFTAVTYVKGDAEVAIEDDAEPRVFLLDIAGGEAKAGPEGVTYAIWSPDGQRVLLGGDEDDGLLTLQVTGPTLAGAHTLAEDAAAKVGAGFGRDTDIYPGWLDNDTVHYLASRAVYGTAGKNLFLVTVDMDGSNRTSHQHQIDAAAK